MLRTHTPPILNNFLFKRLCNLFLIHYRIFQFKKKKNQNLENSFIKILLFHFKVQEK